MGVSSNPFKKTLFAVTAPGLSKAAAQELQRAGFQLQSIDDAGVTFEGDPRVANRMLAIPTRIVMRLGSFKAANFEDLAQAKAIAFPQKARISKIEVSCHKSRLYHSGAVEERLWTQLEALRDPDSGSLLLARIDRDVCTLSLDTSGELLHKRGWRLQNGPAPLRETLAAGILEIALSFAEGFGPIEAIVDPMCGSGTFAIEAAARALGLPPGRLRSFDCDRWNLGPKPQMPAFTPHPIPILGGDRSLPALNAAQKNAERAGVQIAFSRQDAAAFPLPGVERGLILCNPPYDRRAQGQELAYERLAMLLDRCPGWPAAILCPKQRGAPPAGSHHHIEGSVALQNGGLPVTLWRLAPNATAAPIA